MGQIEIASFTLTVAASTEATARQNAQVAGRIFEVGIHWPGGCNGLVRVRVSHGAVQIVPRDGGLAMDNVLAPYQVDEPIARGEPLEVVVQNTDGAWPHTITVTASIRKAASSAGGGGK